MANASLAARYRPQTFAQVVGQDMVKSILSRAAQEDRVAPAYLLSGTRGVGKTTIARIFAKALNCANAPTGEPCNECDACRRITQGSFVDVVEIDGASNRGIDDVRRLRDAVGYAPLEGRYKVFIIDEAHMLTKEAFNALLKTLEEPPARVTFIMATTEQHKFPVTIVSRCQHFVFRQIPESTLEAHVTAVLEREGLSFEAEATRLVARRAAGSVRDAMSLLGQALALTGGTNLTAAQTRDVLGLAGQEVMERLLDALVNRDALAVSALVRELLFQGADMGFFLRELGTLWRNLFLLRQAGPGTDVSAALDLPEREITRLAELAARFSLTFIHAAWQMTLDGQRRILTSLEPAAGLELLLLNLALLPRLLPLGDLDIGTLGSGTGNGPIGTAGQSGNIPDGAESPIPSSASPAPSGVSSGRSDVLSAVSPVSSLSSVPWDEPSSARPDITKSMAKAAPSFSQDNVHGDIPVFDDEYPAFELGDMSHDGLPAYLDEIPSPAAPTVFAAPATSIVPVVPASGLPSAACPAPAMIRSADSSGSIRPQASAAMSLEWPQFLEFCQHNEGSIPLPMLRQFDGVMHDDELCLQAQSHIMFNQLQRPSMLADLKRLLSLWAGHAVKINFLPPPPERQTSAELREGMLTHPVVQALQKAYDGTLLRCTQSGPH